MRSFAGRSPQPRHLLAALVSAGLVLVLHGWLLSGVLLRPPGAGRKDAAAAPQAVQVRQIVSTAAAAAAPVLPPAPSPRPVPPSARRSSAPAAASPPIAAIPVAGHAHPQPIEAPVYATRLPPPVTLHYSLRRGAASGQAVLRWSPEGGRYALSLHGDLPAAPKLAWTSQGTIDAHGIAPDRYSESRRGRELRAANFQRDSARITFSGPQLEHALPPGAQDRLSWMLQLGAVLAAEPGLDAPGQEVLLFVVGSRGDAEVWTFAVQGRETIDLPGVGDIETVLLRRLPRLPYDTLAEVWLDPRRHFVPVRTRLTLRAHSTLFELEKLTLP